jgi:hypothetical protein
MNNVNANKQTTPAGARVKVGNAFSGLDDSDHRGSTQAAAAQELRRLLSGQEPSDLTLAAFGDWQHHIQALRDAWQAGGTDAVRAAFDAMARQEPALAELMASKHERKIVWSAAELLSAEFPEPAWIVPGILPTGLTCLAGRPKVGKSWLLLQLAVAVGAGGVVFNKRVARGHVLYLALEDTPRRLKKRLSLQQAPSTADITFVFEWPQLGQGGLSRLQAEIESNDYRLVIIDTFSRVVGRADQDDVGVMTAVMAELHVLAQDADRAVVLCDHHRKPSFESDPIDDILGSTAKAAVVDTAIGLYRERGKRECMLKIVGRDVDEQELIIEWDALCHCWQLIGEAGEVRKNSVQQEILQAIDALHKLGELATTAAIAKSIGKDQGQVNRELAELMAKGMVIKLPRQGRQQPYGLPSR